MKKIVLIVALILVPFMVMEAKSKKDKQKELIAVKATAEALKPFYTVLDDGVEFSRVIQAPNYPSKDSLYLKCLEIMNVAYKDAKSVIQTQDKEGGLIVGKGIFTIDRYASGFLGTDYLGYEKAKHNIKIEIRDGRFKVTIKVTDNIYHFKGTAFTSPKDITHNIIEYYPAWADCPDEKIVNGFSIVDYIYTDAINMLDLFENEINKPIDKSKDNW